jgi:hypothetical protein
MKDVYRAFVNKQVCLFIFTGVRSSVRATNEGLIALLEASSGRLGEASIGALRRLEVGSHKQVRKLVRSRLHVAAPDWHAQKSVT